jgi:glucose-6-phosphate 1-epimerase
MTGIATTIFGALPAVAITAADGAQAIVTLYGAHVISWTSADGAERLFCSASSALDGSRAIRGGVPVIFPQFAERGPGMRHGFARVSTWRLHDSGQADDGAFAVFALGPDDLAAPVAAAWPHPFSLTLRVAVQGGSLSLTLDVRNTGAAPFDFGAALHTYFAVDDLEQVAIEGAGPDTLRIADKLDQVFAGIDGAIVLRDERGALRLEQDGFGDAVVWNPGAADAAALADLGNEEYRRFVCIEPAVADQRSLAAGAAWRGAHTISSIP